MALDGNKVQANASRHSALSYGHAEKIESQLCSEVKELLELAEQADAADLPDKLSIPDLDAVWFQFNQVRDATSGPSLAAFADTLRDTLRETRADHLIVDVRHNNGGNSGLLQPLLRTLVTWQDAAPGHRIWVVTGRNTFSAAQSFINHVERWTDAVFVGEPSSSRPNFSGEETSLVLPWSGVRGTISSRYFQDSGPLDHRQWIDVDLPVPLTADHYFAGHDPVLAAIASAIRSDASPDGIEPDGLR